LFDIDDSNYVFVLVLVLFVLQHTHITIVLAYVIVSKVRTSTFYLVVLRSSVYVCTLHSSVGTWNVLARHFVILVLVLLSTSESQGIIDLH
jgi:hypothetical protein